VYNRIVNRFKAALSAYLLTGLFGCSAAIPQEIAEQRPAEIHGTILNAESDSFMLRGVLMFSVGPSHTAVVGKIKLVDKTGSFDIKGVMPGRYFFSPEGPHAAETYFKQVECGGLDYSTRLVEIDGADSATECRLTFARDVGKITGQVVSSGIPVRAFRIIVIPEAKELRSMPDHKNVSSFSSRANGRFEVLWLIPGKYLVFAVPADSPKSYNDLDFADRNQASAQCITVKPRETATVNLKLTLAKH
jgi:hypothetical protein